jgi:hypothetical protein
MQGSIMLGDFKNRFCIFNAELRSIFFGKMNFKIPFFASDSERSQGVTG